MIKEKESYVSLRNRTCKHKHEYWSITGIDKEGEYEYKVGCTSCGFILVEPNESNQ